MSKRRGVVEADGLWVVIMGWRRDSHLGTVGALRKTVGIASVQGS